jgi:hypothetical protein
MSHGPILILNYSLPRKSRLLLLFLVESFGNLHSLAGRAGEEMEVVGEAMVEATETAHCAETPVLTPSSGRKTGPHTSLKVREKNIKRSWKESRNVVYV